MSDVLALSQPGPVPSSWRRPRPVGARPVAARYLRQASQAVEAAVARIRPDGARVVLDPGPWELADSVTPGPAGWFGLAAVVRATGFGLGRHVLGPAELAQAIWSCPRWRGRPVLVVTQPTAPAEGAGPMLGELAFELGTTVYAADGGVRFTFGRAFAERLFWCWRPGGGRPEPAGRLLPPLGPVHRRRALVGSLDRDVAGPDPRPTPVRPPGRPAPSRPEPVEGALGFAVPVPAFDLTVRRMTLDDRDRPLSTPAIVRPEATAAPGLVTPGSASTVDSVGTAGRSTVADPTARAGTRDRRPASWTPVSPRTQEGDRERLRAILDWKFQAHSRAVTRAQSLHPGLRGATGAHDGVAGLVAVLALLDGEGDRVNRALREDRPDDDVRLLARCAAAGLVQLPAVGGPVFVAGPAELDPDRYHPGAVVAEPAFTEVSLTGGAADGAPRFAIWSATARRLHQLGVADEGGGRAMFPAGTRFSVLGVDQSPGTGPCVLLRELVFAQRAQGLDERALVRLRDAVTATTTPTPVRLDWPLGHDGEGRPFAADPAPKE